MKKNEKRTEEELIEEFLEDFFGLPKWEQDSLHFELREMAERMIDRGWYKKGQI